MLSNVVAEVMFCSTQVNLGLRREFPYDANRSMFTYTVLMMTEDITIYRHLTRSTVMWSH